MGLRFLNRSAAIWLCAAGASLIVGCSDAVRLTQDANGGGIVTYLFKEDRGGPMGSPHRKEALKVIEQKCPAGYTVIRDGEVKGATMASMMEGQEGEMTGRHWGIQFRCKS
jgi:hypothetical protein